MFRRILLLLGAFALLSGTTAEFARATQYVTPMAMDGVPCNMAMPMSASGDTKPMAPCKGMTPDCLKLMGCITVTALPARYTTHGIVVQYGVVDYPAFSSELTG
ncbi:MAG: hypothetical protein EPN75_14490, partial [Beijerinckiaceae bacterium]